LPSFPSIERYQILLKSGETNCVQAVQRCLSAIRELKALNCFIEVFEEEALQRASLLDSLPPSRQGRLHGVVIGIKDNICYKNHKVSAGSRMLENFHSLYSATAIERILEEGAIIIGRQNCDEFGMGSTNEYSFYGPVLNPYDPGRVAGGSSGGSAAAVSAGMCMASLGSDTGGSVRLPASYCGVIGYKPAYGRISRHGLVAYASSFDQIGILANYIPDISLLLEIMSGEDERDSTTISGKLSVERTADKKSRIAYFPEWIDHTSTDPELRQGMQELLGDLALKGHEVAPVPFQLTDYIVPTYYILTTAEASSNLARYDGARFGYRSAKTPKNLDKFYRQNRSEALGREVRKRIMLGSFVLSAGFFEAYFTKAQQVRRLLVEQTHLIFNDFDFILAPTSTGIAPVLGSAASDPIASYLGDIFTVFSNLVGLPSVSLPLLQHSSNLPLGVQVLSSPQNEVSLQRFSHQLMQQ
jgi:aspartyl-tRNA(Asn)/glutamyl-tRNA(Gln) amidotransferase subunit A